MASSQHFAYLEMNFLEADMAHFKKNTLIYFPVHANPSPFCSEVGKQPQNIGGKCMFQIKKKIGDAWQDLTSGECF